MGFTLTLLLPVAVILVGLFLLVRLRFFFIVHPIKTLTVFFEEIKNRETRRSFLLALAGTLGVGNIFGVATGIMIGGPGCLFWIFVCSFFAMVIKYSETLLVFDAPGGRGGMCSVISRVFGKWGSVFALIYGIFTIVLSLFMGSAMQSAALSDALAKIVGINPLLICILLLVIFTPCISRGTKKIESATEIIIPLTTIIYIIMCFMAIFMRISRLPSVIFDIIKSAFSFRAPLGGISALAIKEGFARGIMSNEAGVGSSALAHSRAKGRTPHAAGIFGMFEVVFDTTLLCMLTGIVILVSGVNVGEYKSPMSLVTDAFFSVLGEFSAYLLAFSVFAFAYSTIICWFYYGRECVLLYFPRFCGFYSFVFLVFIVISGILPFFILVSAIDLLLLFMTLMTLSCILIKNHRIYQLSLK